MAKRVKRPRASVQQHFVRVREIVGTVLCVYAPLSPTKRCYRAVIEVGTINFVLKAETEQSALVERYRDLLKGLTFPLQILVRNQRLDLRPYLAAIQAQIAPEAVPRTQAEAEHASPEATLTQWPELAASLVELLQHIGSRRTLIERHCYLIVPAPDVPGASRQWGLQGHRRRRKAELMARAVQDLAIRVESIQAQLSALGLRSRQMAGEELAQFYHSCVTPEQALLHPLQSRHLSSVGHFPPVTQPTEPRVLGGVAGEEPATATPLEPVTSISRRRSRLGVARPAPRAQIPALPAADFLRLADLLAPASITEERDALTVDGEWTRGIAVTAFPREVSESGWLAPLLMLDEVLDLSLHLHPQPHQVMMRQLRRRRVGYSSANRLNRDRGRLEDLEMGVAQSDATRLMSDLAAGQERIFEVSFLLLVRATSRATLDERSDRLLALLQTVFLDAVAHPTTFEHAQALRSCFPEARDELARTMTLDSASIATMFPFMNNALIMPGGTFLGLTGSGEPVLLDPWHPSFENPHAFVGRVTGAGKSYFGKLWMVHALLVHGKHGERIFVIDPDGEYAPLVEALGGSRVRLAAGSSHHLNPFDLVPAGCDLETYVTERAKGDRLAEKVLDLLSLLDLMLADHGSVLSAREKSLLDRALYETYRKVGISPDPRTHFHQPPLLRDLADVLKSGVCGVDEFALGVRLSRYIDGSLAGLFSEPTNVDLDSHLLVWDIRDLRGDLRAIGIFLIADMIWTQAIQRGAVKRALYIDEAASLIEHPEGGRFLSTLSRRARKRYLRLVVMTQNPETFCEDQYGSVVAANAAIKILKKQDSTSVQAVAARFGLTKGEEQRLLAFGVAEALLLAGDRRVLLSVRASPQEHALITTNPVELAEQAARGEGVAL